MSLLNPFVVESPILPGYRFPRLAKVIRYVVGNAITAVGYGLVAFGVGAGFYAGAQTAFRLLLGY